MSTTYNIVSREVLRKQLGRPLSWDEVCHHLNLDPTDNRPENLIVITASTHASLHGHLQGIKNRGLPIPLTEQEQLRLLELPQKQRKMGTKTLTIKRPDEATPERALALYRAGVRPVEMAKMWGISRPYIYYLLRAAGWTALGRKLDVPQPPA